MEGTQLWHCWECLRAFQWSLVSDNESHWSNASAVKDGPSYCSCCGSYACVKPGPLRPTCVMGGDEEVV